MEWTGGECTVGGVRLHYARGGQGSPVIMLHGVTDNGRYWGRTASALAARHDVVLLDQRGHGRSDAPAAGYDLASLAADAASVLAALRIMSAAVVGHSLGARVALTLAATQPTLVSRLVLEDPPLDLAPARTEQQRYDRFAWLRDLKSRRRDELIAHCRAQWPWWEGDDCVVWAESKLEASPRLWGADGISIDSDWRAELRAVACPLLLVRGAVARGSLVEEAHAAEALRLARAGQDTYIAESGHSIHRDQPAAFAGAVVAFLEQPQEQNVAIDQRHDNTFAD